MPRRVKPTLTITSSVVPYKTLVHHFNGHKIGKFVQAFTFTWDMTINFIYRRWLPSNSFVWFVIYADPLWPNPITSEMVIGPRWRSDCLYRICATLQSWSAPSFNTHKRSRLPLAVCKESWSPKNKGRFMALTALYEYRALNMPGFIQLYPRKSLNEAGVSTSCTTCRMYCGVAKLGWQLPTMCNGPIQGRVSLRSGWPSSIVFSLGLTWPSIEQA